VVEQDNDSTRAIYGKHMMFRNILSGKATTPKSAAAPRKRSQPYLSHKP
jgi:lipid-binding SYLF domain-containing protein